MSQEYQIAFVPVSVTLSETVQLADVMGRVPVHEMVEVLESEWARAPERSWQRVDAGAHVYRRVIAPEVTLEVSIDVDRGQVTLRRAADAQRVRSDAEAQAVAEQGERLRQAESLYTRAVNELVGETLVRALPGRIRELFPDASVRQELRQQVGSGVDLTLAVQLAV